ncbi:hypothetical protein [Runella sp.]
MSSKLSKSLTINSITGKTITKMSWTEIRALKGKSLKQTEFIAKVKNAK